MLDQTRRTALEGTRDGQRPALLAIVDPFSAQPRGRLSGRPLAWQQAVWVAPEDVGGKLVPFPAGGGRCPRPPRHGICRVEFESSRLLQP
jgi:hypothetical protein